MLKDLTGKKFGRLLVISRANRKDDHKHTTFWMCQCDCGKKKIVRGDSLKSGAIRSCTCLMKEKSRIRQHEMCYKHGKSGSKIYITWKAMVVRCNKKTDANYFRYGGRGIKLLWKSFEEFYKDMGDPPTKNHSIDRIDNNGPYSKNNCRWATNKEQSNNRRSCFLITYQGRTQNMKQWADEKKIGNKNLWNRLHTGWSIEEALSTPVRHMSK